MKRSPALDGLRAVAVVMVIAYHVDKTVVPAGHWGVLVFLVLAGYLITRLLCDEIDRDGQVSFASFYLKRGVRLYPALVVLCVVLLATGTSWSEVLPALGQYSNYARVAGADLGLLTHTWFLAVMAHFYLLWPLAIGAVQPANRLRAVALMAVVAVAWRIAAIGVASPGWVYNATDTNAAALIAGCLLGVVRPGPWRFAGWSIPALYALMFLPVFGEEGSAFLWGGFAAIGLGVVAVHYAASNPAWLQIRPIGWLGQISYAIYLVHYVLLNIGMTVWAALPLTVAIAAASWYLMEKPLQRWGSRAVKQQRQGASGGISRDLVDRRISVSSR